MSAGAPKGLRPIADPRGLKATTEAHAEANRRFAERLGVRTSSSTLPAVLTDPATELAKAVRLCLEGMAPTLRERAERLVAAELLTMGPMAAREEVAR